MPRTRVVIQSRLSSSRLPGKALLTIAGMPLVELVARRASRSGHEVVVATSEEQDDGRIAEHLRSVGVPVLRGPLDDVLGRFVLATADLDPADRVVRLTGDNPVADADLVDELLAAVAASGHTYGRVDIDRVPEGLGAEVFSVGSLRLAAERATASYDREHVTPWLRRELGELLFVPSGPRLDPRRFRCTVDVLADYVRVSGLFTGQTDPVQVPWRTLMAELAGELGEDAAYLPLRVQGSGMSALVLGLDQMMHADPGLVRRLLRVAQEHGVSHVDTGMAGEGGQAALPQGQRTGCGATVLDHRAGRPLARPPAGAGRSTRRSTRSSADSSARSATWGDGGATSCSSTASPRRWPTTAPPGSGCAPTGMPVRSTGSASGCARARSSTTPCGSPGLGTWSCRPPDSSARGGPTGRRRSGGRLRVSSSPLYPHARDGGPRRGAAAVAPVGGRRRWSRPGRSATS